MAYRFAYHLRHLSPMQALESPHMERIRLAWPSLPDQPEQSVALHVHPAGGTLAIWPALDGANVPLEGFGKPRETHDALTYYPSLEAPTLIDLIRPESTRPPGAWVTSALGHNLFIPGAYATARELVSDGIGKFSDGDFTTELGKLARSIWPDYGSKEGLAMDDTRLPRLVFLALRCSYNITEEMHRDYPWIAKSDLRQILPIILGQDPKAFAVDLPSSP